jgi:hypothetical protein
MATKASIMVPRKPSGPPGIVAGGAIKMPMIAPVGSHRNYGVHRRTATGSLNKPDILARLEALDDRLRIIIDDSANQRRRQC